MKIVLILLGCLGLVLGVIGAILPLLPAFPFLLLAAVCFAKSSEKLHSWFISTKLYRDNLESYVKGRGMTWKTKLRIMLVVTATMAFGFAMMGRVPVGRIILACVWALHILYFIFGIRTISRPDKEEAYCQVLKIHGMKCEDCAKRLEQEFCRNGCLRAEVDFGQKVAVIYAKEPVDMEQVSKIVSLAGCRAVL